MPANIVEDKMPIWLSSTGRKGGGQEEGGREGGELQGGNCESRGPAYAKNGVERGEVLLLWLASTSDIALERRRRRL
jgi:hypothetical protein